MECFCDRQTAFDECCGQYLENVAIAPDAVSLMRSRYAAFATQNEPYLLSTWHPETKPSSVSFEASQKWIGLKILSQRSDGARAFVDFVARYKIDGRAHRLKEHSEFTLIDGRWYYLRAIESRASP